MLVSSPRQIFKGLVCFSPAGLGHPCKYASGSHKVAGRLQSSARIAGCVRRRVQFPTKLVLRAQSAADNSAAAKPPQELEERLGGLAKQIANLFPLWLTLVGALSVVHPPALLWFRSQLVTAGLALTMGTMGTTLSLQDFKAIAQRPQLVGLGAMLQFSIMPLMGFLVSRLAQLPSGFAVGICIVASCPGGVASNVVTFLANADLPLSVAMTTVSTILAVIATPTLTRALVGTLVPVDPAALLISTLQVVLLPIAIALHSGGFLLGYWASRVFGLTERQCRTNSIEVGMQNSALGAVLASLHFADPLTPVPCAISACCHSLIGSALATFFRSRDQQNSQLAAVT
ncbi:hypothetical protein WJX73_003868 [Symbiochloris irregularis]|uniref:Uncharacterized protein n=1 Tax=Symbiochloris irregularis TaxID=706552 RepID=A0AAW1NR61_9CHLO